MRTNTVTASLPSRAHGDTLGVFVRAIRERLLPADFGLAAGRRRRAKGLRREEAAALCGISPTWYTWIEQDRAGPVSARTLADMATGLRLTAAQRAYLFQLGGRADPEPPEDETSPDAPLAGLVRDIASPAYVLDRHWQVLAANDAAVGLFGGWILPSSTAALPNLLCYVFLDPDARRRIADWEERARRIVAEYRADSAGHREDPEHGRLVDALCAASPVFAQAWRSQEVLGREGGQRSFHHPERGLLVYWQFTLRMAQQPTLKLVVLQSAG